MKRNYILFSVLLVFLLAFIIAAPTAPTGLVFNNNVTAVYDEGNFFLNWTAGGGGDIVANYTIYIFAGNVLFSTPGNDSTTGYVFSNTTEANYTFIVQATNITVPSFFNSTLNASLYVDTTSPVVRLPIYTNGTSEDNATKLTLNISVTDASSGVTGTHCLVDVNGTNQTLTISSGWCNGTISLIGVNDGNQTINVWANDTVNNFQLNNSFVVQGDSTGPSASASCTPTSVNTGDVVTCTCSGSDTGSGLSSTSSDETPSTSRTGSFTYTCTATDNAGNTASDTKTYTVNQYAGRPTRPPVDKKIHTFTKITPGTASIVKDFSKEIGLKEIQILVENPVQNVKITVEKYDEKPSTVSIEKSGKVRQYLQIDTENLAEELQQAILTIRVEKTWILNNGVEKDDIALFRFNEDTKSWDELATNQAGEDDTYYFYTVELNSFSTFAISERGTIEETQETDGDLSGEEESTTGGVVVPIIIIIVLVIIVYFGLMNKNKKGQKRKSHHK